MNDQDWRRVSQGLAVVLAILVVAVLAVVLLRRGSPGAEGASPSSSSFAGVSPSTSASPSIGPSPSRTPRSLRSPKPSGSPGESPSTSPGESLPPGESPSPIPEVTASPAPTPTPTLAPTAPLRSIRFLHVGIDGQSATTPTPRTLTFASEGPGQVTATLFPTSAGDVKFCLYTGNQPSGHDCRTNSHAVLTGSTTAAGNTRWHVSAIGVDQGTSPSADVKLEFRSNGPRVTVDGFRFQGTTFADYNGIAAQFKAGAGQVHVNGRWAGAQRPWRAGVVNAEGGENAGSDSGTGSNLTLAATVSAGSFRLTVENTEEIADQEVFLHAVISWP